MVDACCIVQLVLLLHSGLLQEQRNILAIAVGLRGIAAIRAVLNWAPVQAHATSHKVSCFYVTKAPSSAAFLAEWDQWREAGVSGQRPAVCGAVSVVVDHVHLRCWSVTRGMNPL